MKTDRELLELAAKAAGHCVWVRDFECVIWHPNTEWTPWNPLTNDGDALRLAVTLNEFEPYKSHGGFRLSPKLTLSKQRRAIVRAAAEIGKAME